MKGQFKKLGVLVLVLIVMGCSPAAPTATSVPVPTATALPTPTAIPTPIRLPLTASTAAGVFGSKEWHYVNSSDSQGFGFPRYYAAYMEQDLGVKVTLHDWSRGAQSLKLLLSSLRLHPDMRRDVREAEVITFQGEAFDYIGWRMGLGTGEYDCSPKAIAAYKADLDATIDEIFALRKGKPTIIIWFGSYQPFYKKWKEWGQYEEYRRCSKALGEAGAQARAANNIPVADVLSVFNGPNHDEDPNDKGLLSDGIHPTDAGDELIADIFRKLGYPYIIP